MLSCLMDAWVSLGHFPAACEPTVLRLACQYLLGTMGCGFHRCTVVILAPSTTTGGSSVGPRPLFAPWQGGPWHIHVPTLRGPSSSISTAWLASWLASCLPFIVLMLLYGSGWPVIILPIGVSSVTACAWIGKVGATPGPSMNSCNMILGFCLSPRLL